MEISIDSQGVVIFRGNLVASNIENIHSSLESLLEEASQIITLDLSNVDEIDISGLQLLYSLKKSFEIEGTVRIRSLSPALTDVFNISGFGIAMKEAMP